MQGIFYLTAIRPADLGLLIAVAVGCKLLGLLIFFVFYSVCNLSAGLSMRLAHTYIVFMLVVSYLFVFRDLMQYFVWWHYTPGPVSGVMGDAILVLALCALWLILVWGIWPRPKRVAVV